MSSGADAQVNQQTQQGPGRNGSSERPRSRSPAGGLHRSGSVVVHDHVRAADAMPDVSDAKPRPSTASGGVKESIRSKLDAITKIHATGMARAGRMLRPDERTRARHAPSPRRRPASTGADGGQDKKSEFLGGVLRRFMPGHSNRGRHSEPQVESNQPAPRRRAHFYSRSAQLASPSDSRSGGGGTPTAGARRTSDTGRMRREWSSEATAPGQGGIANREPTGAGNGNSTLKDPRAGGSPTVITDLPGSGGGRQDGVTASNGGTDDGHDAASAGAVTPFPDAAGGGDRRERPSLPALFGGEKKMFPSSAPVGDGGATPSSGGGSRASGGGGKTPPGVRRRSAATDTPSSNASGAQLSAATEFLTAALTKREAQIEEMQAEMVKLQEAVASREASAESLRLSIGGRLKRWRDSLHDMEVGWLQRMEECDRAWGREVARNLDKQAERAMKTAGKHFSAKADELERRIEEFKRQQEAPSFIRARLTTAMYLMSSGAFTVVGRVLQVTAPVWRLVAVFFAFFYGWYLVVCGWCGRPCGRGVPAPIVAEGDAADDGGSDGDSRTHRHRRHRHGRHKHRHRHRQRHGSSASSTGDLSGLLDSASVGGGADRPGAVELSVSDMQLSGASRGFDIPEFGLDEPVAPGGDDTSDRRRDTTRKRHKHKHKHKHKHGHESKHKHKHGGSKHKHKQPSHGDGSKGSSDGHSDTDKHHRHRRGHSRPRDDSHVDARSHVSRRGEKTAHKRARSRSRHRRGKHRSRSRSRDRTRHRSRHKRHVDSDASR